MIIAFVGSGGKTTTIKEYAERYRQEGKRVFVTTSTHMKVEEETIVGCKLQPIVEALETKGYAFAGQYATDDKVKELPYDIYEEACKYADVVLVEADGSKQLPLKFPNDKEPVIYENVDEIVIICGLSALHQPAYKVCHRFELVKKCLSIEEETPIEPWHIQRLLQEGYMGPLSKKYPKKKLSILPRQMETMETRAIGALLKEQKDVSLIKETWFQGKTQLFICGGGHVAYQLAQMARYLDFQITVMDNRKEFANQKRFPHCQVICDDFSKLDTYLVEHGFYVVVTRGHQDDYQCVCRILNYGYDYLGMIGSHKKVKTTMDRLEAAGYTKKQRESIHAPIGLSIKAQTPGEIAVSILAEMIQEKNKEARASVSTELLNTKKHGVLCVIIGKKGSAPRDVGSMMLVTKDDVIDTIGGGAVEHAVILDARKIEHVQVKEYNLDSKSGGDLGMICGGSNQILFLPI